MSSNQVGPEPAPDPVSVARKGLGALLLPTGVPLGDVIARLVLGSGIVEPWQPPVGPRTGLTFTELEDAWFDANEHAQPNLDVDGRPIVPLLAQVERPPAQNPHTVKVREVREDGKDPCWKWTCACGQTGWANTSIEADYWGEKHTTASERIDELNNHRPIRPDER